jgi:hypothetical protein
LTFEKVFGPSRIDIPWDMTCIWEAEMGQASKVVASISYMKYLVQTAYQQSQPTIFQGPVFLFEHDKSGQWVSLEKHKQLGSMHRVHQNTHMTLKA